MRKAKKIFYFVALIIAGFLAFLPYIFTHIPHYGRGSHMTDASDLISAGQIVEYVNDIKNTVTRIMQGGIKADALDFNLPNDSEPKSSNLNSVFQQIDNFLLPLEALPSKGFDGEKHYVFTSINKIPGIGTDAPEILFITWPIKKKVCLQINRGLGLGDLWAENHILIVPPDLTPFHHEIGQSVTEIDTTGQQFACVQDKNNVRYYIATIVER